MKRKTFLHLALAAFALGAAATANADCWHDFTGEKTGSNYNDPQCKDYVGDTVGKAAFGTPSNEERTYRQQQQPASKDCTDPAYRNDPQCMQPGQQMAPGSEETTPEGGGMNP